MRLVRSARLERSTHPSTHPLGVAPVPHQSLPLSFDAVRHAELIQAHQVPRVRVLGLVGELVPGEQPQDPPRYENVRYRVQLMADPGQPVEIVEMPIAEWRALVGMPVEGM
jgi:hypothetical protein